ncbi:hypothetical protein VTP01DRAFT_10241 [Rhizomucor pusillus]|uniref:uncharacterized protein n=1 Tax=Rhizomucor pusillus TaxID=4840 RepID=UPI003744597D
MVRFLQILLIVLVLISAPVAIKMASSIQRMCKVSELINWTSRPKERRCRLQRKSAETYPEMERRQLDFVHLQSQHESISIVGKLSISTNHRNYFCSEAAAALRGRSAKSSAAAIAWITAVVYSRGRSLSRAESASSSLSPNLQLGPSSAEPMSDPAQCLPDSLIALLAAAQAEHRRIMDYTVCSFSSEKTLLEKTIVLLRYISSRGV